MKNRVSGYRYLMLQVCIAEAVLIDPFFSPLNQYLSAGAEAIVPCPRTAYKCLVDQAGKVYDEKSLLLACIQIIVECALGDIEAVAFLYFIHMGSHMGFQISL